MVRMFARLLIASILAAAAVPRADATWSIVIADCESGEVAVGTVTCLNNFDLVALVPVIVVGKGGAAVQASGDFDGIRRPIIFEQLMLGTDPADLLDILSGIAGHQSRQYGIVDTQGRAVTFTGSAAFEWAGGVTGQQRCMVYAIQGNILAGGCVVPAIEQAILFTDGDIPERLMAGMQAAKVTGGDGRCSCSTQTPTACGCPPVTFQKSGHIGGMVVARIGDTDDGACNANGCADGDSYMRLNVAFQPSNAPDPVDQLQQQFDAFRTALIGAPDAVHSTVSFDPPLTPSNGFATTTMTITLRDWQDQPASAGVGAVTVEHGATSAGRSTIGPVTDAGGGVYEVVLTAGEAAGVDRFVVSVTGDTSITLMPEPSYTYLEPCPADLMIDGTVGVDDLLAVLAAWGPCGGCPADVTGDGAVDVDDLLLVLGAWGTCAFCVDDPDCNGNGACDAADLMDGTSPDCDGNLVPDECDPDCNGSGGPDACDVAAGTSPDCNGNGLPDECDVADGTSPDCNENGVPDACDVVSGAGSDCNGNGVLDACDLDAGTSADWDDNGVPDECEFPPPDNDGCATAQPVPITVTPFTTVGATTDGLAEPSCFGGGGEIHRDVWFNLLAPCNGALTVSVCDADFDTRLAVYVFDAICPPPADSAVACDDDGCGAQSTVTFQAVGGTVYRVRVGGGAADQTGVGSLDIQIVCDR